MLLVRLALGAMLSWSLVGCSQPEPKQDPASIDTNLAAYVLDEVPSDVKNPTFVDFESKVQLIGWEIEPTGVIAPGQPMKLKLYWKSSQKLSPGWSLFTHLVAPGGARIDANVNGIAFDDMGPLRSRTGGNSMQALPPSAWQPGKIYVDMQDLQMPQQVHVPEVSIVVGVWKGQSRLDVISGSSDRERRAIVVNVRTGVVPPPPAVRAERPQQKS
ncbi:MAG: hypothetical protein IPI67_07215 [Myxococcales bacterium]|nr:hypothetical protein [Myxococcales bacterium]